MTDDGSRNDSICIVGAGAAGLITAHTLLQDGFSNVHIFSRDKSVGGTWATGRVYPNLLINNVYGEYCFSAMRMPPPKIGQKRVTGADMNAYMETFARTCLFTNEHLHAHLETEVDNVRRAGDHDWKVTVRDNLTGTSSMLSFSRVVLCTGGCSSPYIPADISPQMAQKAGFSGSVVHSSQFFSLSDPISMDVTNKEDGGHVVIVGGGRSAQDICAYLARKNIRVSMVFESCDAVLATPIVLPDFIRKSRFLSVLSGHIELHTRLERFLHQTWIGAIIVHLIWSAITLTSFISLGIPSGSPLRSCARSLFWGAQVNDEGTGAPDGFHALVAAKRIQLIAPARVQSYGHTRGLDVVVLADGTEIPTDAVVLATGYSSSWSSLFDEETLSDIGMFDSGSLSSYDASDEWRYKSMTQPPSLKTTKPSRTLTSMYRGIVPAKNIHRRDFAVNGAVFTTNPGYAWEITAHWISSYFLGDTFLRLPPSSEAAMNLAQRQAVWTRLRYPCDTGINESYASGIAFWDWPQHSDDLLDDMGLDTMRSGGNWLTWPFKVIRREEIACLREERKEKRVLSS